MTLPADHAIRLHAMDRDEKPILLKIMSSRTQTKESVRKNLAEGHKYLREHKGRKMKIEICIRGFENDARHPACIKDAKICIALAFEEGLAGLIIKSENNNLVAEVYSMAYLDGKVKMVSGKKVIRFKKVGENEVTAKILESCDAYAKLLNTDKQSLPDLKMVEEK